MYTKTIKDMCVSSQNGRFFGIALFLAKNRKICYYSKNGRNEHD